MWRKLRKLIPDHLQFIFSKPDHDKENESRQFAFDTKAAQINFQSTVLPKLEDQEYLDLWNSITKREREVVALVCLGHRNYEIAELMSISPGTVKSHLENIFHKWNVSNRHDIRLALRDWDFKSWWEDRHMLPLQAPKTR